jgi:hypothetical protein
LRHATFARRGTFLRARANSFRDSRLAWIRIFLILFLFRHANLVRRDTFLQVAADFLLDPLFPRVLSFFLRRRYAARFQTLRRFLGSPNGISEAFPVGKGIGLSLCRSLEGGRLFRPLFLFAIQASILSGTHLLSFLGGPSFRLGLLSFLPACFWAAIISAIISIIL